MFKPKAIYFEKNIICSDLPSFVEISKIVNLWT